MIDFEKGIFQKFTTDDATENFLIRLSDNSICAINSYLPGLITVTGDLSPLTKPRDRLITKALEDTVRATAEIFKDNGKLK